MVNVTLSIPEELKEEMNKFPEINWSAIIREAIRQRIVMLDTIRKFTRNSEMTEADAIKLGREVNKALAKRRENELRR